MREVKDEAPEEMSQEQMAAGIAEKLLEAKATAEAKYAAQLLAKEREKEAMKKKLMWQRAGGMMDIGNNNPNPNPKISGHFLCMSCECQQPTDTVLRRHISLEFYRLMLLFHA